MLTIRAQVESPRPNHRTIRESLSAAYDLLKLTAGGAAGQGLYNLIALLTQHHR
jgi:hypothetical protein